MRTKLKNTLNTLLLNGKLRKKLIWIYFFLVILPLGLFTFYAFRKMDYTIQEQTFSTAQNSFDEATVSANELLSRLSHVADILVMDTSLYDIVSPHDENASYSSRLRERNQLTTTFNYLRTLSDIDRIRIYVNNDHLYTNSSDIVSLDSVKDSDWFQSMKENISGYWFSPADFRDQEKEEQEWYSFMRVIYNPSHVLDPIAIIRTDISAQRMSDAIKQNTLTKNGILFLLNGEKILWSSSKDDRYSSDSSFPPTASNSKGWNRVKSSAGDFHLQSAELEYSEWHLLAALPHDDIFRSGRHLFLELLFVVLLLGAIAYSIAYYISRSILKRLLLLNDTIHNVEKGLVSVRLVPSGNDEIGQLMVSFDRMMTEIDTLMNEKLEQGQQIKALELKALQAQINPHFLYNSLDLINCMAIENGVPQICKMVNGLAQFYRISLNKGKEILPISQELQHARLYIEIQNLRFENKIQVFWDIAPEILDYMIIKIVLQPIIENAMIHGIFEKEDKKGRLWINGGFTSKGICITIKDDGIGMEQDTVDKIFSSDFSPVQEPEGYGIRNIHERLRLAYGAPYGLSCQSKKGQGTQVTIFIPALKN